MAEPERPGEHESADEARVARLLAERARALAVPPAAAPGETVPGLAFTAGADRFVVTLDGVLRVERVGAVARVPGVGAGVLGAIRVEGRPCALVDVPALLSGAPPAPPRRWAIVLGRRVPELALSADGVDLVHLPAARVRRGAGPRAGITADAALVLDAAALLAPAAAPRRTS